MGVLTMARQRRLKGGLQIESYTGLYVLDAIGNGAQFITSGVLKVRANTMIDAFLVGGGGGGGHDQGGGGGGGYTKTARKIQLVAGQEYEIVIGQGGEPAPNNKEIASAGETTSAFGFNAEGGKGGGSYSAGTRAGGEGGSGGGGGAASGKVAGDGGSNGENGVDGTASGVRGLGGKGQGYTTRAFAEENGKMFSGGGGGACTGTSGAGGEGGGADGGANDETTPQPGTPNTGGGGGGGNISKEGSAGGSGIVIIRAAKAVGRQSLFDAGNEHEGLTNGWIGDKKRAYASSGAYTRADIVRENGQIIIDGETKYAGVIRTSIGVDMTPYKTLVFEGEFTRRGTDARNLTAAVWSEIGTYYATESEMLAFFQMENAETINRIELDVSDIDGFGYPGIGVTTSSAKITACYLIPKD